MVQEVFLDVRLHAVDVFQSFLRVERHDVGSNPHDTAILLMQLVGSNVPVTDDGVVCSIQSSHFGQEWSRVLSKRMEEQPVCYKCNSLSMVSLPRFCKT